MNNDQNNTTGIQGEPTSTQPVDTNQPAPAAEPVNQAPATQPVPQPVEQPVPQPVEQPVAQQVNTEVPEQLQQPATPDSVVNNVVEPVTPVNTTFNQGNYGIVADEPTQKSKKKFPIGILVVIIILVLALGGGAVWYFMASSPKNVIKNVITNTFKEVNNAIDEYDKVHSKFEYDNKGLLYKGKLKISSNLFEKEEYKDMKINPSDYYFGINAGISPKDKSLLIGGSIEGTKKTIGFDAYYEDQKIYIISEVLDNPIVIDVKDQMTEEDVEGLNEMFESFDGMFKEVMETLEKASIKTEDLKYISSTLEKALINSLDDKKMTKGSGTVEVNGKTTKATKITYEFDKENLKRTIKSICDSLINDDKFIEIIANITVSEKSDVKDSIKEFKESINDIELEKSIYLNIYTTGLTNKYVGMDFEQNNKKVFSYYVDGKNSEITIKGEEDITVIKITEEKEKTTIIGTLNGKEYITLNINTKDPEAIDFSATLTADEKKATIEVYLKNNISKSSIKSDFKFSGEYDDTTLSLEGNLELIATDDKLTKANLSKSKSAEKLTDQETKKILDNIEKYTKEDEALNKLYEAFEESISEIINQNNNNESSITCTGTTDNLYHKYYIAYNEETKEFTNVTLNLDYDKSEEDSSQSTITLDNYCTTLKTMDTEIKTCEAVEEGNLLKATVTYSGSYISSALTANGYTSDLTGIKDLLTTGGLVCTITQ